MNAVETLLRDPMASARERSDGIGYVGLDVPQELAFALDVPCLHLPWRADRITAFADSWLESSFPGWARSILEDWASGLFDALRAVVFSRGDDASQRLYYYVCELQRRGQLGGPEPIVLDVARIPRESSARHTRTALAELATRLDMDDGAWRRGIQRTNALREAFARIAAARSGDGAAWHRVARASLHADVAPWLRPMQDGVPPRLRVLLAGSAPPDERLHDAVARAGGDVVSETHGYGYARLGPRLDADADDPLAEVARNFHQAAGPRSFADPAQRMDAALSAARADAVVLWLTREDEALAWHVPGLRRVAAERGVPLLALTARTWNADDGALTEIERFVTGSLG